MKLVLEATVKKDRASLVTQELFWVNEQHWHAFADMWADGNAYLP